jgi:hypothetical protein
LRLGDTNRKAIAITLALATTTLTLLTAVFMANGYHREFARGVADGGVVATQLALGATFLLTAALGVQLLVALWQGRARAARRVTAWFLFAVVLWLVWAYVRAGQYAS